jgi:microcystin-dependent protein
LFDQQFQDFANWVVLPCAAAGSNNIVLTPQTFVPNLPGYGFFNLFSFVAAASSSAPVFAQYGALASLPVYLNDGVTQAGNGSVTGGAPYFLMFSAALNSGNGGFFLSPIAAPPPPKGVPPGSIEMFGGLSVPVGWIYCNGQAVPRTGATLALFNAIGTAWGVGDGSTTFNVPDLRGYFTRGYDDGRGVDPGRSFASIQQDQVQSHEHNYLGFGGMVAGSGSTINAGAVLASTTGQTGNVGTETRPKNIAVIYIISE